MSPYSTPGPPMTASSLFNQQGMGTGPASGNVRMPSAPNHLDPGVGQSSGGMQGFDMNKVMDYYRRMFPQVNDADIAGFAQAQAKHRNMMRDQAMEGAMAGPQQGQQPLR